MIIASVSLVVENTSSQLRIQSSLHVHVFRTLFPQG